MPAGFFSEFGSGGRWSILTACFFMDNEATLELIFDALLDLLQVVSVQVDAPLHLILVVDLRCLMADIGQEIEAREVRDVVEGHLFDCEAEPPTLVHVTEWSIRRPLGVLNPELALVAHFLEVEALFYGHGVRVLELLVLGQFERVEAVALSEGCEAERWERVELPLQRERSHRWTD